MKEEVRVATADFLPSLEADGFVVVPGAVDVELCHAVIHDLRVFRSRNRRIVARAQDEHGLMSRFVNLHLVVSSMASVFADNRAIDVCDEFFQARAALYTSIYFERGSEQDLHRDAPLFTTRPAGRYLGVWAAFEDVDSENGALKVVPGSHRLPPIDVEAIARELYGSADAAPSESVEGWNAYQERVSQQAAEAGLPAVEVAVRRGDVIIWHPFLLHGGAPHRSMARTRRSLVMHVTPEGVPVYHQDVFFDPSREVAPTPTWGYYQHHGRPIADLGQIDLAHRRSLPVSMVNSPDAGFADRLRVVARRARAATAGRGSSS